MPESEITIDISSQIPAFLREQWLKVVIAPSPGTVRLGRDWSIEELRSLVLFEIDAGGC